MHIVLDEINFFLVMKDSEMNSGIFLIHHKRYPRGNQAHEPINQKLCIVPVITVKNNLRTFFN